MLKNDVSHEFFKFKVFLPVWPQMRARLLMDDYYEKVALWNRNEMRKENEKQTNEVGQILDLFKEAQFNKQQGSAGISNKSEIFDTNWQFIQDCVFAETFADDETEFKGNLWVKELFILASFKVV